MGVAFYRGGIRLDLLVAAQLAAAVNNSRPDLARDAMAAVEPATVQSFEGGLLDPDVYLLTSDSYCVVAVQGTRQSYVQWAAHVLGSAQSGDFPVDGAINLDFGSAALLVYNRIRAAVLNSAEGRRVVYVGHSLGGAVAQILAAMFVLDGLTQRRVFTFGAPRVGNTNFAASFSDVEVIRCEDSGDPIPSLPPVLWGGREKPIPYPGPPDVVVYRHAGTGLTLDAAGELSVEDPFMAFGTITAILNGDSVTEPHFISTYAARLRAELPEPDMLTGPDGVKDPVVIDDVLGKLQTITQTGWGLPPGPSYPVNDALSQTIGGGMPTWRATFFFEAPGFGWTESFYRDADSYDAMTTAAEALAKQRIGLCGEGVTMPSVRISDTAKFRDFGLHSMTFNSGTESSSAASHVKPYNRLLVNLVNAEYRNRIFLGGVAASEYLGDKPVNAGSDFKQKLKYFAAQLKKDQWAMKVQARFAPDFVGGDVAGVTNAQPIVVTTSANHTVTAGQQVRIRGVKGNKAANGLWYVDVPSPTTLSLRGSTGDGAYIGGGAWRVIKSVYKIIQSVELVREVSHKTGRPSSQPVGRRRTSKAA